MAVDRPAGLACSIVLSRGAATQVWPGSDQFAATMEHIQCRLDEGPSRDVLDTGVAVSVPDLELVSSWPMFAVAARLHGLVGLHSEPVRCAGQSGAITWYSRRRGAIDAPRRHELRRCAHAVSVALTTPTAPLPPRAHPARREEEILSEASALLVARAVDLLMTQMLCGPDEAFALLGELCQDQGRALHVQAAVIVDRAARAISSGQGRH